MLNSYLVLYVHTVPCENYSDASERTQRRRPLLVCLLIEPEYRTFFKSLFKLLTLQPLSENSRINILPPKHEICMNFLSKCELQRRLIAA